MIEIIYMNNRNLVNPGWNESRIAIFCNTEWKKTGQTTYAQGQNTSREGPGFSERLSEGRLLPSLMAHTGAAGHSVFVHCALLACGYLEAVPLLLCTLSWEHCLSFSRSSGPVEAPVCLLTLLRAQNLARVHSHHDCS